jgi:hypothetical protein
MRVCLRLPNVPSGDDDVKILIACTTFTGHLNPMLSIGRILVEEGHAVVFQTASMVRDRVEGIGAIFRPFPPEYDYDLRDLDAIFPERKTLPPPERVAFDLKQIFTAPIPTQHKGIQEVLRDFPADVVMADASFFGTYPMLLGPRANRPVVITCGIMLVAARRRRAGHVGLASGAERRRARKIRRNRQGR